MLSILLLAFAADLAPPQMPALPEPVVFNAPRPSIDPDVRAFMLTLGRRDCTCADGGTCQCGPGCECIKHTAGEGVKREVPAPYSKSPLPSGQQFLVDSKPSERLGKTASKFQSAPVCTGPNCAKAAAPRRGIFGWRR